MTPQETKKSIDEKYKMYNELYHEFIPFLRDNVYSLIKDDQWLVLFSPQKRVKNDNLEEIRRGGMNFIANNRRKGNQFPVRISCEAWKYEDENYIKKNDEVVVECRINFTDNKTYWDLSTNSKYDYLWNFYLEEKRYFEIKQLLQDMLLLFSIDPEEQQYYPRAFNRHFNRPIWEITLEELRQANHNKTIVLK